MFDIGKPTFPFLRVSSLLSGISLRRRLIGYSFKEVKRRERIISNNLYCIQTRCCREFLDGSERLLIFWVAANGGDSIRS